MGREQQWVNQAILVARSLAPSVVIPNIHTSLVLVGGTVVSVGVNRYTGTKLDIPGHLFWSAHAEWDALRKLDRKSTKIVVAAGIKRKTGSLLYSAPCEKCQAVGRGYNVELFLFHNKEGIVQKWQPL